MADPTVKRSPRPAPPSHIVPRILTWTVAALVSLLFFGWMTWMALKPADEPEQAPAGPPLYSLVPADALTPNEGTVRAPTQRAHDGDLALLAGDEATAAAAYDEAWHADARDRYAALLAACVAIEQGDFARAAAPLAAAAGKEPPLRCSLRAVRLAAAIVDRHARRADEPIADLYLRALADEVRDAEARRGASDPLAQLVRDRLLAARVAPLDPTRLDPDRRACLALVADEAGVDVALEHLDAPELAVELAALTRLYTGAPEPERPRLEDALRRRSAAEPDNAYYEFLLAAVRSPAALASRAEDGEPAPALATEDEPDVLPALSGESLDALEEASRRRRCDPHLRELLALDESLRREAGDPFAPLHVRPAREWLFLGDPNLAGRIRYRALVAEPRDRLREQEALLLAAVALSDFAGELAHDPFAIGDPNSNVADARVLLRRCDELGVDRAPLARRILEFRPLVRADASLATVRTELDWPLPIPRLVRELFDRYAADRSAQVDTLRRYVQSR